jgi:hypothetical protein
MLIASKEVDLDVKAQKAKHMCMIQQRNAGQHHNMQINNKSFQNEAS